MVCMGFFLNLGQPELFSLNEASSVVVPFQTGYSYNTLFLKPLNASKHITPLKMKVVVTGYTSRVSETDNDPFVTASGHLVEDGVIAANFLPFGTKVRIPELFGDKVFVARDRMAPKYNNRVDIWFNDTKEAFELGVQNTTIEVF